VSTHSRRTLSLAGLAGLAIAVLPGAARARASTAKNKLVLQVSDDDPKKWGLALNNARNVQQDIGMLKAESPQADRISAALKSGVKVVACENTMKAMKLTYADMLPDIGYVPAGVVELMQKQQQGYAYIRT
jgi:intracellular sulfur oxidation DsrE/DsrF family protein